MRYPYRQKTNNASKEARIIDNQNMKDIENDIKEVSGKADNIQNQVNTIASNAGNSNTEIVQARVGIDGNIFQTIKQRIDSEANKIGVLSELGNSPRSLSTSLSERGINVKDFGAKGDWNGTTGADDSQKIIDAATYAKANDMALYLPKGNYYCSVDVSIDGIKHIIFDGTITLATGKTLDISYNSYLAPCNWKITNVAGGLLRLSGLNSSRIEVIKAKELEIYAHGDNSKKEFTAYNTFILGKIDTLRFASEGTKAGWINENKFFGGRMSTVTLDGNFHHDNNIFYGTMLEGFKLTINKGISNHFYDVRMEGTNTITFAAGTSDNIVHRSWLETAYSYLRDTVSTSFVNNGFNNQVVCNLDSFHKKELFFSINSNSNNFPVSALTKNQYDLTIAKSNEVLFESDLIELKNPFGIVAKSDKSLFFIYLYAYDAGKNLLLTEQTNFTALSGGSFSTTTGAYGFGNYMGIASTGIPVFPNGVVKYIKYKIQTGSSMVGQVFNYLNLVKIESNIYQTPMKFSNKHKRLTSSTVPTVGYFEKGDIVWNEGTDNTIAFWRRLTTGTTHVLDTDWKAHG